LEGWKAERTAGQQLSPRLTGRAGDLERRYLSTTKAPRAVSIRILSYAKMAGPTLAPSGTKKNRFQSNAGEPISADEGR